MLEHLLHDPTFWVAVATIGFALVALKLGRKPLLGMLDARSEKIRADLEEAERLKNEAQELLADSQKKHRDAIQTSQKIIDAARETSARIQKDAEQKLAESMKRREAQLIERIKRAEADAVNELRQQAADLATKTAEILLQEAMPKRGSRLVDEAIEEIPQRLSA
ncbi:MAG TPA: F0F1 ATP synthase subunit B [Patescibacteria group bacterium]|nr:F0F1 ATP synthase subunit B [Patescibacteria group bacterium]